MNTDLSALSWCGAASNSAAGFISVPSQMFIGMALADSDHGTVAAALHEIAAQELSHAANRGLADIALKASHCLWREVSNDASMAIELLLTVVQEPLAYQERNAALLAAPLSVWRVGGGLHGDRLLLQPKAELPTDGSEMAFTQMTFAA